MRDGSDASRLVEVVLQLNGKPGGQLKALLSIQRQAEGAVPPPAFNPDAEVHKTPDLLDGYSSR